MGMREESSTLSQAVVKQHNQQGEPLDSRSSLTRVNANLNIASDRRIAFTVVYKTYKRFKNLLLAALVCNYRSNQCKLNQSSHSNATHSMVSLCFSSVLRPCPRLNHLNQSIHKPIE